MSMQILVIDDGELDAVRAALSDLGLEFETSRASKLDLSSPLSSTPRLLVTTGRIALEMQPRPFDQLGSHWIAVVEGDSKTQRARLRRLGFDYLVPSQSHPAALRALLLKCVYRGRERHAATRVALGIAVGWRRGWHRGRALLVDLSIDGCRLMLDTRPERGQRLTLRIPLPGHSRPLCVRGQVVRTAPAPSEGGREGQVAVGVRFLPLAAWKKERLEVLLRERSSGPAIARWPGAQPLLAPPTPVAREERKLPRAHYGREIDAMCCGATRALLGRDLSESGVRVERSEKLQLRERVRLALYGCASGEPIIAESHVERDDGDLGLLLRFDWIEPADQERLRRLIAASPKVIRRLSDDAALHVLEVASAPESGEPV